MVGATNYDVIIIGSGAGGGTLALKLAGSGKSILILERGDYLPREKENWDPTEVFVNNRYVANDKWHDKHGKEFQPGIHYVVGGATKMYRSGAFSPAQRGFQRSPASRRHFSGLASFLRRFRALLYRGRGTLSSARPAWRRSDRTARQQTISLIPRSPMNRASSGSTTISSRRDIILSTRLRRSCSMRLTARKATV